MHCDEVGAVLDREVRWRRGEAGFGGWACGNVEERRATAVVLSEMVLSGC